MVCKSCWGGTSVIETRESMGSLRRRRSCVRCGERFTTYEVRGEGRSPAMLLTDTQVAALRQLLSGMQALVDAMGPLLPPMPVTPAELEERIMGAEAAA